MIQKWYTTTFTVKRQEWSHESSANVSKGTFLGHIQQMSDESLQQFLGLRFSKAFKIYCAPATDVQEGDRIENGSINYDVKFVIDRNIGNEGHLEVIVEKV